MTMDDFLSQFVKERTLWCQGAWRSASLCRTDVLSIAERLSANVAVIPDFHDNHLFFACMVGSMMTQVPILFLSDRSAKTLNRLRARYDHFLLVTDDGDTNLSLSNDQILRVVLGDNNNETVIDYRPAANQLVLEAQTSGSTGIPNVYYKNWSGLIAEADTIGRALQLNDTGRHVISTVPLHHMYGFTYALFGPLRWGMSIDAERPVYPLDLSRVVAAAPGPAWVVTTPTHLRAYVASAERLPQLAGFICSAAPLPVDLAKSAEERFGCPIIETYGSTETGAIAWRYPTRTDVWTTYDALTVSIDDGLRVHAAHLPTEGQLIDDCVELLDESRFRIVGRASDLVKIAGKRASLSELTDKLRAIDGVEDGVFLQTPDRLGQLGGTARLAAFVVIRDRKTEEVLAALRECIDSVFLPRPLIPVPQLPRNSNGKLPREALDGLWQAHARRYEVSI